MRIGIFDLSVPGWTAGGIFSRVVAHGLSSAARGVSDVDLKLVSNESEGSTAIGGLTRVKPGAKQTLTYRQRLLRKMHWFAEPTWLECTLDQCELDVLLPIVYAASAQPTRHSSGKVIGWIPDFQHVYLPEYFSEQERRRRDASFLTCTESSAKVLLSSQDALTQFVEQFPQYANKGEAISFPSIFAFQPPLAPEPLRARERFELPAKFILVANQFWAHKNHITVVRAAAALRRQGRDVVFVFTGKIGDDRGSGDCIVSEILQEAAALGVWEQIRFLGLVSRSELLDLIRTAVAVLQPSRWEGWSTTIQDAKALGRPIICSDIGVHREQAPEALFFFPPLDHANLADQLASIWDGLVPGPDVEGEKSGLLKEREFAHQYGEALLTLCRKAVEE